MNNRLRIALLWPIIVFLFLIGWSLYWVGHQQPKRVFPAVTGDACLERHRAAVRQEMLEEVA